MHTSGKVPAIGVSCVREIVYLGQKITLPSWSDPDHFNWEGGIKPIRRTWEALFFDPILRAIRPEPKPPQQHPNLILLTYEHLLKYGGADLTYSGEQPLYRGQAFRPATKAERELLVVADLENDPNEANQLWAMVSDPSVVLGTRIQRGALTEVSFNDRDLKSVLFTFFPEQARRRHLSITGYVIHHVHPIASYAHFVELAGNQSCLVYEASLSDEDLNFARELSHHSALPITISATTAEGVTFQMTFQRGKALAP